MKWLFLLLLIINIGIFAWGYQHEQVEKQSAIDAGADVGEMRLISEVADVEKKGLADETKDAGTEVVIAKAEQPDSEHTTLTEAKEEIPADEKAAAKDTVSKPEVAVKEESPPEIKHETEVKEDEAVKPQVASLDKTPQKPEVKKQDTKKPGTEKRCGVIGPLKDHQVAKDVMEGLKKSELEAKLERKIEKEQIGYWVVIPPLPDGSQAQAKIDELTQVGLKDIWHFRGGGMKNAISLGMFAQKENAENFGKEMLKKGFNTEMRPRYLNKTKYLVKFTIAKSKNATEDIWHEVEQKYSKLPFSEQACE